jgi:hypothetical protein
MSRNLILKLRFGRLFIGHRIQQCLSTKSTNKQQEQEPPKLDGLKSNSYFSKYEAKLKAIYK